MITVKSREDFLKEARRHMPTTPLCCELGVLKGDFSEMLFRLLNATIIMVDPFKLGEKYYDDGMNYLRIAYSDQEDYDFVSNRFKAEIANGRAKIEKEYSFESVCSWEDFIFHFIYHDASHLYEDLSRDLVQWKNKLRPDGLMCGHDYIDHPSFGVKKAVDEFCAQHNFEMIIFNENGGDYALKRKVC